MHTIFAIASMLAMASAATLRPEFQVRSEMPEGYDIVDLSVIVDIDGQNHTMVGTVEKIAADIEAIKPDFQFDSPETAADEDTHRSMDHILCNIGGGLAETVIISQSMNYLRGLG
ncbi:hypothetical protein CAC42_2167 [Sphaceloma murrayae]|uniref:Uncharacterized protein n=1 Tax=Sphaceloma murrayae TaxID=2082308 RepID=A0A2K1QIE0_9PEZI|nr:hypothetical protein CAC42_2167 [Sphaceloma murrayae]